MGSHYIPSIKRSTCKEKNEQPSIISNDISTFIHARLFAYLKILREVRVITVDVVDIQSELTVSAKNCFLHDMHLLHINKNLLRHCYLYRNIDINCFTISVLPLQLNLPYTLDHSYFSNHKKKNIFFLV
jgi:hypothetical protein